MMAFTHLSFIDSSSLISVIIKKGLLSVLVVAEMYTSKYLIIKDQKSSKLHKQIAHAVNLGFVGNFPKTTGRFLENKRPQTADFSLLALLSCFYT